VCRLYNDVRDKVNACERKKESHDEKSRHKDEIKREMEKLEQENRNRIQQVPKPYILTHILSTLNPEADSADVCPCLCSLCGALQPPTTVCANTRRIKRRMRAVLNLWNFCLLGEQLPELDKKREDSKAKILRQRKEYEGEDRQNDLDITEMWQQMAKLQDYENKVSRSLALLRVAVYVFARPVCVCACACVCAHVCVCKFVCTYTRTDRKHIHKTYIYRERETYIHTLCVFIDCRVQAAEAGQGGAEAKRSH